MKLFSARVLSMAGVKRVHWLAGLVLYLLPIQTAFSQPSKEPFYTQMERTVIRLELAQNGGYVPAGTGFFVRYNKDRLFVVTARHVASLGNLRARVSTRLESTSTTDVIELRLPLSRWVYHAKAGDDKTNPVDVAVMRIPFPETGRGIVFFSYCPSGCSQDEPNQLAADPQPPDLVTIYGFPLDLGFTLKEQRPMTRLGVVSLTAEEQFVLVNDPSGNPKFLPKGAFLVDARMFPGNSGGPVIVSNPFSPLKLGGLVSSTNRTLDYGAVTPVSQIIETLERAKESEWQSVKDHSWVAFEAWFPIQASIK